MFTGIITGLGRITAVTPLGGSPTHGKRLTIACPPSYLDDVGLGDSIALNGACMTVTRFDPVQRQFSIDISAESLACTAGLDQPGPVNLEKALTPTTRLGGHLVSGHVDGIGEVKSKSSSGRAIEYWIQAPQELSRYIAEKGSIAVDGISLTVNAVQGDLFRLTIVPHTAQETTIARWKPGHRVNLEVDQIARYLERLMQGRGQDQEQNASSLTLEKLAQSGFL